MSDEPDLIPPKGSSVDQIRKTVVASLNADPTGLVSAGLQLIDAWIPTQLERRTRVFHERIIERFERIDGNMEELDKALATAAYSTGLLASARSASDEHLDYLAKATASAMVNPTHLARDHCILLLRIVGDLTATEVRLLVLFNDPIAVAASVGITFEWTRDDEDQFPREQLFRLDPGLPDDSVTDQLVSDLQRRGLVRTGRDFATQFSRLTLHEGELFTPPSPGPEGPHGLTEQGRQVLSFVLPNEHGHA